MSGERDRGGGDQPRSPDDRQSNRDSQRGQPQQGQPQHGRGDQRGQPQQGQPQQGQPQQGQPAQTRGQGRGQPQQGRGQPRQGRGQGGRGRTQGDGIDFGALPWVSGAIQGVSYFIVGMIAIVMVAIADFVLIASGSGGGAGGLTGGTFQALLYALGWLFYGAHFVSVSAGALGSGNLVSVIGAVGLPGFVYYLVPPTFLFLAGRSIARSTGHSGMRNEELALRGATAVAGYLPVAVVGSIALTRSGIGPDLMTTILIMGLGYPLVFAGLGGYLSKR